ncbi:hypothetical protein [Cloacibacillus evryensis]|uniref:hypothetical protein n=1 Tax=Cloacibacillus evryensis TaxID=508460 RepID=UPI00210EA29A|nr:hypothetical protein [Cloacibacillus evryensis]MCQ4763974.1 hypothetical protein [Cloacibacillus evryensis]
MSKKKFFAVLMVLAMALTMGLAGTALAEDTWNGTTRGPVPAAANNVITITTGAQLAGFADAVNSGTTYAGVTVRLADDINLDDRDWIPIGRFFAYGNAGNRAFKGTFDGMGHTVRGLYVEFIDKTYGETPALFGYIDYADAAASSRSAVKAAAVSPAARAEADAASLGLIGEAYDKVVAERTALYKSFGTPSAVSTRSVTPSYATGGTVKNLRVYGEVINNGGQGAAGVVCWNDGAIENCYFEGTITIEDNGNNRAYAGGICSLLGDNDLSHNTYVVNCAASADVKAHGGSFSYAGGIAGYCFAMGRGYIVNCSVEPGSKVDSYMDAGGIVGGFANHVVNCSSAAASVTVDGRNPNETGYFAGGIIGAYGVVDNCRWLQTPGSTTQPGVAIGGGSDASGLRTSVGALPIDSVLAQPVSVAVNGTAPAVSVSYPTGAAASAPTIGAWTTGDTSIAEIIQTSTVHGLSEGITTLATTATNTAWTSVADVTITPGSGVTVTQ